MSTPVKKPVVLRKKSMMVAGSNDLEGDDDPDGGTDTAAVAEPLTGDFGEVAQAEAEGSLNLTKGPNDVVEFACFKSMSPGPVIGQFRAEDHGILEMSLGRNYRLPRFVAEVLADRKYGQLV